MDNFKIAIIILILIAMINNPKLKKMLKKIPKNAKPIIAFVVVVFIMTNYNLMKTDFFSQEDTIFQKLYSNIYNRISPTPLVKHSHVIGGIGGIDKHLHEVGDEGLDPITGEHNHPVVIESVTSTPEPLTPEPLTPEPEAFSF